MSMHSHGWRLSPGQWATVLGAFVLPVTAAFLVVGASRAYACPGDGCCGGGGAAPANEPTKETAKQDVAKPQDLLVDLGNAKCPVMGGKPDGKTWSEWNGVRVGHCCPGCTKKFAADPEKYLAATGVDWKAAADAVKKVNEANAPDRDKALADLKQKWTVVRELAPPAPQGTLIDLGNAACPIMGGEPDGKTWSEWNGLRIGHCCPGCTRKFAADPEKYLAAAEIDWKAAAAAVKAVDAAKGEERAKALAELKKKWTVLREPVPDPAKAEEPTKPVEPKK